MKKQYTKPAMSVYPLPTMQLLAGSGLGAGDQGDPFIRCPPCSCWQAADLVPVTKAIPVWALPCSTTILILPWALMSFRQE